MAKYRGTNHYIGAWGYVGLEILYGIPVIGWIFLIVHCFSSEHENRMHFARHFFARLLVALVVVAIAALVLYLTVGRQYMDHQQEIDAAFRKFQDQYNEINKTFNDSLNSIKFD